MPPILHIVSHRELDAALAQQVLALCSDAYEEDFTPWFDLLGNATHVLAIEDGEVVSHAAWVARELRLGAQRQPLACAYVEAVATPVRLQGQGLGTLVLQAIPPQVQAFDIAALSPSEPGFYARSGWELWEGPLFCTQQGRRISTPDEQVMIHRLPRTPAALSLRDELEADWREGDIW